MNCLNCYFYEPLAFKHEGTGFCLSHGGQVLPNHICSRFEQVK